MSNRDPSSSSAEPGEPRDPEEPGTGEPIAEVPAAPRREPPGAGEADPSEKAAAEQADFVLPKEFHDQETQRLVERAKGGDVDALNRLFTRYHGYVVEQARRRIGPRLRAKEEPDDLAQTTFREATRDFGQYEYRGEGSLVRWLGTILQNKIRDKAEFYSAGKRDVSRERAIEERSSSGGEEGPRFEPKSPDLTVTAQVLRAESYKILREALEHLSDEHRKAITLVFFEGLSLREAGRKLGGRSEDAVRMLLRRAEAKLREITRRSLRSGP